MSLISIDNDYQCLLFIVHVKSYLYGIRANITCFILKASKICIQKAYSLNVRNKPGMANRVRAAENLGSSEHDIISFDA